VAWWLGRRGWWFVAAAFTACVFALLGVVVIPGVC
jgi:hypothetical protein